MERIEPVPGFCSSSSLSRTETQTYPRLAVRGAPASCARDVWPPTAPPAQRVWSTRKARPRVLSSGALALSRCLQGRREAVQRQPLGPGTLTQSWGHLVTLQLLPPRGGASWESLRPQWALPFLTAPQKDHPWRRETVKSALMVMYGCVSSYCHPQMLLSHVDTPITAKIIHHYSSSCQVTHTGPGASPEPRCCMPCITS
ncbi:Hypothetical predicted protein [Marmota monax]|uniref:MROH2B-like HEAT-repeats domain-containing protein n=1 Tax=Marmota monax TaxID=9995 RepID=A0A5E4ATF9_MARMO|nr:Hypothetical predicted protein [Marmota monax]